ncbi:MAG: ABC transporter permease, partial [bacterium]
MLKNYLKIAFRNLVKNKTYALINIAGLAIGMACCVLILFYVYDELSYDRHHENAERIYRLTASYPTTGKHWACIGPPVGPALKAAIPEIEQVARFKFSDGNRPFLRYEEKQFQEDDILYADSTALLVFSLPLVQGNPATALREPRSLILTQRMAQKYFGEEEPMGRVLVMNGNLPLTVTGVLQNLPHSTHLPFDSLISMPTFYANAGDWVDRAKTWAGFHTYVLLREPLDPQNVEQKFPAFISGFFADQFDKPAEQVLTLHLQPLTDIHLHSRLEKEIQPNSDIAYVYIFSVIAVFVLLIACVNFINLATAQFTKRLREVGIRKVMGAYRTQLVKQFLGETLVMTFWGLLAAFLFIELSTPVFQNLTGKTLSLHDLNPQLLILGISGIALFTGLVSGSYPAFYLSRLQPVQSLRGLVTRTAHTARLRKGLVIFQFAISIFLIAGAIIIHNQLEYFRNKQLGFDQELVVKVPLQGEQREAVMRSLDAFKQSLRQHPAILSAAVGSESPGERFSLETIQREDRKDAPGTQMRILWGVDQDYLSTLGVKLVQGRNFSNAFASDSMAFILNEAGVRELDLQEPLGAVLRWNDYVGPVVGVAANFHFASLHHTIEPLIIPHRPAEANQLLVRTQAGRIREALSIIRSELDRVAPNQLFVYSFLSEDFNRLYRSEDKLGDVFLFFTGIAILVACLGLFGLVTFAAEQRTKEIGVRKVLGATVANLVGLLSKDFVKLVLIANLIAWPIAYLAMNKWLQDFAYRIDIGWWVFALAGGLALLITLLTVG